MSVSDQFITDRYALYCGDCIEVMKGVARESVHLVLYSPPFLAGSTRILPTSVTSPTPSTMMNSLPTTGTASTRSPA